MNFIDFLEEVLELSGQYASLIFNASYLALLHLTILSIAQALDSVCLAWTSLPICKDCTIIALDAWVNQWLANTLEHLILCDLLICDIIETKSLSVLRVQDKYFIVDYISDAPPYVWLGLAWRVLSQGLWTSTNMVRSCQWPHPDYHLHILWLCAQAILSTRRSAHTGRRRLQRTHCL